MTFAQFCKKNESSLKKYYKLKDIKNWQNNINLPNWSSRNKILRNYNIKEDIKDDDGFIFKGNKSKFDITNKLSYYHSKDWQKMMAKRIKIAGGKCEICGSTDDLTCHHVSYERWGGNEIIEKDLKVLCKRCHMLQHKDKPECQQLYQALMSSIRELIINVKSDGTPSIYVFTDCEDTLIKNYMIDMYKKAKIIKYIKNCRLYKTQLEGEPNKANDRWFAIGIDKNNTVVVLHQCNSKKEAQKYKKSGLKSFTVFKPSKTIDSEKLKQIYHPKKK